MVLLQLLTSLTIFLSGVFSIASPKTIDGLYVNTFGNPEDQALIFLHGGPGYNSFSFEASVAQQMAKQGFFVIVYDQRGSGRSSPARSQTDFTYKSYVQDLKNIIDLLEIKNPVLMGHSFGGSLALSYINSYPHSVRKVILVAAPISMPQTFRAIIERSTRISLQPTWDLNDYQKKMSNLVQIKQVNDAMFGLFPLYGTHMNGKRYIPPQIIGAAFSQAMTNGTYEVQQPTEEQKNIDLLLAKNPDKNWLNDMKAEPMFGFAQNENYATFDFFGVAQKYRDRIFAMYGAEDGLFDQMQLEQIKRTLPAGHFHLISEASHAIFQHQRSVFIEKLKSYSSIESVSSCTKFYTH